MHRRNRRTLRAMRDVHKLSDMLVDIVEAGGSSANAARRLLHWAAAQQRAAATAADDGDVDDTVDAVDAEGAEQHAQHQQHHQRQQQQHQQQQQQQQQQQHTAAAAAQPAAVETADDDDDDGAVDADDADDAAADARRQKQRLHQQQLQHQQQQQHAWQQQQPADGSCVSPQLDTADGASEAAYAASSAPLVRQQHRQQQPQQRRQQQQQQPQQQQTVSSSSSSGGSATWQPRLLPRAGSEQWEQWDFRRRSGGFHKNRCGAGNAAGTRNALVRYSTLSMVCCASGCSALVDYKVARRQAKQAGRVHFEHGDGCAGPAPCSADHRAARFAKRQHKQAAELEAGRRLLICWPAGLADGDVWYYPQEAACEAAAAARAAL